MRTPVYVTILAAMLALCLLTPAMKAFCYNKVKVVSSGESAAKAADCRRMLVGPHVNRPDHFPGGSGAGLSRRVGAEYEDTRR